MIRHPVLVVFQCACAAAIAAVGHYATAAEKARDEAPLTFALSVLGENENRDGAWEGLDLLANPGQRAERFQLTVRPDRAARVTLDVLEEGGPRRIFPALNQDPVLAKGRSYALPGPSEFYELDGNARLRLTVTPASAATQAPEPRLADPAGAATQVRFPLSDGAKFDTSQRTFRARGAGVLELDLRR
jgi:hypothetical protein